MNTLRDRIRGSLIGGAIGDALGYPVEFMSRKDILRKYGDKGIRRFLVFYRILLCTDGLYNAINDETLHHTLQCAKDVEQVADKYRAICAEKAGDNYTAIIIEME